MADGRHGRILTMETFDPLSNMGKELRDMYFILIACGVSEEKAKQLIVSHIKVNNLGLMPQ